MNSTNGIKYADRPPDHLVWSPETGEVTKVWGDRTFSGGEFVQTLVVAETETVKEQDDRLRWCRAASWARGQSMGPYAHGLDRAEAKRIETLRDRIRAVGEDAAWDEYEGLTA